MPTVLVTGASRGVGLALARRYAERGYRVLAGARAPAKAGALAALAKSTDGVRVLALDVTDEKAVNAAAAAAIKEPIDIVICNAGVMSSRGSIGEPGHDAAEWHRVLATNVIGVFVTANAFLPALERAKGRLAIISSQMGSSSQAYGSALAYRVSKAAAANLGLNISATLKPKGVAVGIFHPGWVSSDMGGSSAPTTPEESAAGLIARIDKLSLATTGVFEDFEGKPYPF